jgi:glycogen debranching enzyme
MSYHNGSIWPHDNAMIALGFARYGFTTEIDRVFRGLFEAAAHMDLRRLPELFCGFQRTRGRGPTMYPVACSPQAWAASAPYALLQAMLGLEFVPSLNEIRLRRPRLPSFLDQMTVRNLQLGRSSVDVSIHRHSRDVSLHVNKVEGDVQVSALYC